MYVFLIKYGDYAVQITEIVYILGVCMCMWLIHLSRSEIITNNRDNDNITTTKTYASLTVNTSRFGVVRGCGGGERTSDFECFCLKYVRCLMCVSQERIYKYSFGVLLVFYCIYGFYLFPKWEKLLNLDHHTLWQFNRTHSVSVSPNPSFLAIKVSMSLPQKTNE